MPILSRPQTGRGALNIRPYEVRTSVRLSKDAMCFDRLSIDAPRVRTVEPSEGRIDSRSKRIFQPHCGKAVADNLRTLLLKQAAAEYVSAKASNTDSTEILMMKRLFLALWPDEAVRRQCSSLALALPSEGRRVRPANLHVTLVFLGHIDVGQETALRNALPAITMSAICLRFDTVSYWVKPRILCLTASEPDSGVMTLAKNLSALARQLDIRCDDRPYQPHVTLVKKAKTDFELTFDPIVWSARSFCLVASCPSEFGIDYRIIERWPRFERHTSFD